MEPVSSPLGIPGSSESPGNKSPKHRSSGLLRCSSQRARTPPITVTQSFGPQPSLFTFLPTQSGDGLSFLQPRSTTHTAAYTKVDQQISKNRTVPIVSEQGTQPSLRLGGNDKHLALTQLVSNKFENVGWENPAQNLLLLHYRGSESVYQLSLSLRPRCTQGCQESRTPNCRAVSKTLGRKRAAEKEWTM